MRAKSFRLAFGVLVSLALALMLVLAACPHEAVGLHAREAFAASSVGASASAQTGREGEAGARGEGVARRGPVEDSEVRNFGVLHDGKITRSGKPETDDGWRWLRERGVEVIVNLRRDNSDVDYEKYGFKDVLWIPLRGGQSPDEETAIKFLRFVQQKGNQPLHVMCAEGKDRTGTMSALIRYSIDGWTMDAALDEAKLYRKGEDLSPERVRWLREWAKKHPPGSFRVANDASRRSQ